MEEKEIALNRKQLVAAALLTLVSPVTIEAISQEVNEAAEMRPTIIDTEAKNFRSRIRHTFRLGSYSLSTGLISFMIEIEGESCGETQVLAGSTHKNETLDDFVENFSELRCVPSSDGYSLPANGFYFDWMFVPDEGFSLTDTVDHKVRRNLRQLMDPKNIFDPASIDELASSCDGRCSSMLALTALFAKANFYDSVGLASTAALWRDVALSASLQSEVLRRVAKDQTKYHLYKQYKYAVTTADYGLASWINDEVKAFRFDDADGEKIKAHFEDWAASEKTRDAALGVTLPLATQNPLSNVHAAGLRYINSYDIGLTVESGRLDFAFLNCTADDSREQVQLDHKNHSAWRIPESWSQCELFLLGDDDTKITVWEYPAGSVDGNGNLKI